MSLEGEHFCHAREALLRFVKGRLWLADLEGGNGVFLRIRTPVELDLGDEFVIGDQLVRVDKNPVADDGPDPDPTYFYSSPKWPSSFRIVADPGRRRLRSLRGRSRQHPADRLRHR